MNKGRFVHGFQQVRENGNYESHCNAISFINKSDGPASVNNFTLQVDEALELEGWPGETDVSTYQIVFDATVTVPLMHIIRKVYT